MSGDYVRELGVGGLAALFSTSEEEDKAQDSEKLMDLYWNRAELKKAYAEARNEHYRLKDRIKQQQGATARVQQKLDHIEELLIEPESAYNVIVLYLLRGLAIRCEVKLALFAEQLKQQRENKQHQSMMSSWSARMAEDSVVLEEQLIILRNQMRQVEEQELVLLQQLESMGLIMKLFKGRSVKAEIKRLNQENVHAQADEQALLADLASISERAPPETQGLDIASKRTINLMTIAFAQQLFLQFSDAEFAALVKESTEKSAGGVSYGDQQACTAFLQLIRKRTEALEQSTDNAVLLQRRAKLIGENAVFTNDDDVVPASASTRTVFDFADNGRIVESDVAILGENFWGIAKVLSR